MDSGIDEELVRHVAVLARLKLDDDEIRRLAHELSAIVEYVAQLDELDTADVPPTAHGVGAVNVLRDDTPQPSSGVAAVLANAPERQDGFFRVPKVLDRNGASP